MGKVRKPFQGVWNIIRFNWHFYLVSILVILCLLFILVYLNSPFNFYFFVIVSLAIVSIITSTVASWYVYDISDLYEMGWLDNLELPPNSKIINIHAGFDETSELLQNKFPDADLTVLDFYDPEKHTEISIKRARKAYPPFPNTKTISTNHLAIENESIDIAFAILSVHEIRNDEERIIFFKELNRVVKTGGRIVVTEHLRDIYNFAAYTIGFFHFHSYNTWSKTFTKAGLRVKNEIKVNPFITTFILEKNGNSL